MSRKSKIKIIIADDHAIVRKGLVQIISEMPEFQLLDEATNGMELLEKVKKNPPDIIVLDIAMPKMSGWEVIQHLEKKFSKIRVIVLSVSSEEDYAIQFYKAGAWAYLTKDSAADQLVKAIKKVAQGERFISANIADKLILSLNEQYKPPPHGKLSPREFQIFCMIAGGKTLTEIAKDLSLGVATIGTYRNRVLNKMELENNAQLTNYAYKNKILS